MEAPLALTIYANQVYDKEGFPTAALHIISQETCVMMYVRLDEIDLLPKVREANWQDRGSVRIGQCVGSPVFWCADEKGISLLIGPDDESWGVLMKLPSCALDQISAALNENRDWLAKTPRYIPRPR